jgi:hypothetical protein
MDAYTDQILLELEKWQVVMQRSPSLTNRMTKSMQSRINRLIPEKVHQAVTAAIKQMTRAVIFGADMTTPSRKHKMTLEQAENKIRRRINFYRSSAAVEGAITGVGGFLWGLADFPLWLSLKMKMLHEIATYYGVDVKDYKERIYILHIFQLTFSSQAHRNEIYGIIEDWERQKEMLPDDIHQFDWRTFQLEYRDYIDLAKLFQLIPVVGAVVGAYVNHRLTNKLGTNAMNAYRLKCVGHRHRSNPTRISAN